MRLRRRNSRWIGLAALRWADWRPGLVCLVLLGGLDGAWLRWLQRGAPPVPVAGRVVPIAGVAGRTFYVGWGAAGLHAALLGGGVVACVAVPLWRRRRRGARDGG